MKERATGRDVIVAIGENMRQSLEPLVTKTIAPSLYQVYLHADDYDHLRTLFGELEAEAKALLDGELARLEPRLGAGACRASCARRRTPSRPPPQVRQRRGAVDGPLPGGPQRHPQPGRHRGGLGVRPASGGGLRRRLEDPPHLDHPRLGRDATESSPAVMTGTQPRHGLPGRGSRPHRLPGRPRDRRPSW